MIYLRIKTLNGMLVHNQQTVYLLTVKMQLMYPQKNHTQFPCI